MAVCPEFRTLSLCAGVGGLDLGVSLAVPRTRTVAYVERESYAASALVARMADKTLAPAPIWDNLETFNGAAWRGLVHCVTAGFPCQPWSGAGKREGTQDERWLWPQVHRVVAEADPEWVFLENVPGLKNGGLEYVLGDLALSGYSTAWDCFTAAQVGAPHLRERLFILTYSNRRRSGVGLADALSERERDENKPRWSGGSSGERAAAVDGGGEVLADSASRPTRPAGRERSAPASLGGNAHGERLQGRNGPLTGSSDEWPSWPPSPASSAEWERWPKSLKPAVRRAPNGTAASQQRVDRLHALGNGVVPQTAALAFVVLANRLGCARRLGVLEV